MKKYLLVLLVSMMFGSLVMGEMLYIPDALVEPEKGKYLVITAIGVRDSSSQEVLPTNPPRYPGFWMYKLNVVDNLKELKKLPEQDIVCVLKVGTVFDVEKEFKKVKKEIDVDKFESYKWKKAKKKKVEKKKVEKKKVEKKKVEKKKVEKKKEDKKKVEEVK